VQTQPPVRVLVNVIAPEQHDFDTQPLCEVSVRLRLRNCLHSPASLVVESGSRDELQNQQSGNLPWPLCSIGIVSNGKSCMSLGLQIPAGLGSRAQAEVMHDALAYALSCMSLDAMGMFIGAQFCLL